MTISSPLPIDYLNSLSISPVASIHAGEGYSRGLGYQSDEEIFAMAITLSYIQLTLNQQIIDLFSHWGDDIRDEAKREALDDRNRMRRRQEWEASRRVGEQRSLAERVQARYAQRQAIYMRTWEGGFTGSSRHLSIPA